MRTPAEIREGRAWVEVVEHDGLYRVWLTVGPDAQLVAKTDRKNYAVDTAKRYGETLAVPVIGLDDKVLYDPTDWRALAGELAVALHGDRLFLKAMSDWTPTLADNGHARKVAALERLQVNEQVLARYREAAKEAK